MAKIDKKYHELLNTILNEGFRYEDPNRKGVHRIQIPHYQMVHNFSDGFPALTTKQLYWKGIVGELLWILRGSDNIKYLVDNGINIWNKDAYNYYLNWCKEHESSPVSIKPFINAIGDRNSVTNRLGDIGRGYGAQWRQWDEVQPTMGIDQISNLIKGLKENPMGTKHIVTAWNPAELDQMALPPCHWSFEILVEPLNFKQRSKLCLKYKCNYDNNYKGRKSISFKEVKDNMNSIWDKGGVPKYQLTLKWHQRSVDSFLGKM